MGLDIAGKIEQLEEKIEAACRRAGRKRQEIRLMAVSKFQPPETIEEVLKTGIRLFGESRVQEGIAKFQTIRENRDHSGIKDDSEVHLIGSLQRNKAKTAAAFYDCIQSVDRDSLIGELGALTTGRENPLMILLELHTAEESKAGYPDRDSLFSAAEKLFAFPGLRPGGLMTMAPFTDDKDLIRKSFRELAAARDELEKRFPIKHSPAMHPSAGTAGQDAGGWSCLSMGMTADYEIAIEEGSTLIRIGTAIFGERGA